MMMLIAGLVLAALAALLHVYIFWLESIGWTGARARAAFGLTVDEAESTRELAYNQGFYNLFLAIVAGVGIALVAAGPLAAGSALVFAGTGSMAAAALVLFLSSPDKRGAALTQGVVPLLSVVALAVGLAF
jgi:putative membrane protein